MIPRHYLCWAFSSATAASERYLRPFHYIVSMENTVFCRHRSEDKTNCSINVHIDKFNKTLRYNVYTDCKLINKLFVGFHYFIPYQLGKKQFTS